MIGRAWISALVPAHQQGTAQGLHQAVTGAAVLTAGLTWGADGRTPLLISGTAALLIARTLLGAQLTKARGRTRPA